MRIYYPRMTSDGEQCFDSAEYPHLGGYALIRAIQTDRGKFLAQYRWGNDWVAVVEGHFGYAIERDTLDAAIKLAREERRTRCQLAA